MNDQGIIIAASIDKNRVGSFHETAWRMIQERITSLSTEPGNDGGIGVKYGMNQLLTYGHETIGVVGMTGLPQTVEPILSVVKLALETMVEYEPQSAFMQQRKSKRLHFMNSLLFSENEQDLADLSAQADAFGYPEKIYRVPVLITFTAGENASLYNRYIQSAQSYSSQDILLTPAENELLVFKSLPQKLDQMLENYLYILGDLLNPLLSYTRENHIPCKCYIGSIQNVFSCYRYAYKHCCWMRFYYKNSPRTNELLNATAPCQYLLYMSPRFPASTT